jgi:hypothetical protein
MGGGGRRRIRLAALHETAGHHDLMGLTRAEAERFVIEAHIPDIPVEVGRTIVQDAKSDPLPALFVNVSVHSEPPSQWREVTLRSIVRSIVPS